MAEQDWFAANAPSSAPASGGDWFSANAPKDASAVDRRGTIQKIQDSFDRNVRVNPDEDAKHGAIVNALNHAAIGAVQGGAGAIIHPMNALEGIGTAIAHPIDAAKNLVHAAIADPSMAAGQALGGMVMGQGAGMAADAANGAVSSGAGRLALFGKTPEAAYESALKPSPALPSATRAQMIQTALKNEIPVSKGGFAKLQDQIDTLNNAIKDEIAKDPTRPIDPNKVATRADAAKAKFATQVNAQPDLNSIEASKQQFLNEQGQQPAAPAQPTGVLNAQGQPIMLPAQPPASAPPMNAADAQAMKQGTYRVLKGKFGEQGSAAVEAQKSLARGLKEEIATAFPEIGKLNADESRLLELQPVLERAVNRISNHQAVGIGTPAAGAAMKAASGSGALSSAAMAMKAVLDNPGVKSRLAIAVSKGAKIPYATALARVSAYSGSLGSITSSPQDSMNDGTPSQ